MCEGIMSGLLYFSILSKFSLVTIYCFNSFKTSLNDGEVKGRAVV